MIKSIVLDATHFATGKPTGVEYYVDQLLPLLSERFLQEKVSVSWVGHTPVPPDRMPQAVRWIASPHSSFWSQRALFELLKAEQPDLFFSPSGLAPLRYKGRVAVAIHDLGVHLNSRDFSWFQKLQLQAVKSNTRQASLVLTPTQFTAAVLNKEWAIPKEKIKVIPYGYSKPEVGAEVVPGLESGHFILYVGRIERKKNLLPLIQAFASLRTADDLRLVLAGKDGFAADEVRQAIHALPTGKAQAIILPGYISEGQKKWLYERASICAFPSRAEGFGFPVLEAFAYGVPLVCADNPPLPEVGGTAALYASPTQPDEWVRQITQLLENATLRETCSKLGKERLQRYQWSTTAEQTALAFLSL